MTGPRWLSPEEQLAWRSFVSMQNKLAAALNRQLQNDSQLSLADYEVLVTLTDRADGQVRAFELAKELQWEKSRLSHHIARMERRGLVARGGCPEDARGSFVSITELGKNTIEDAAPGHVELVKKLLFDDLDATQVRALRHISEQVMQNLAAQDS